MSKLILRNEKVVALLESLPRNVAGSRPLEIVHLNDIGLYMTTLEKLPILS